jgi:hypothetical protein
MSVRIHSKPFISGLKNEGNSIPVAFLTFINEIEEVEVTFLVVLIKFECSMESTKKC